MKGNRILHKTIYTKMILQVYDITSALWNQAFY